MKDHAPSLTSDDLSKPPTTADPFSCATQGRFETERGGGSQGDSLGSSMECSKAAASERGQDACRQDAHAGSAPNGLAASGSSEPKVAIRGLCKTFDSRRAAQVEALREIDLDINEGEFVSVIGGSGCGKTTLLRIIGGFEQASSGFVQIATRKPRDLITSTVFQGDSAFPWLTVVGNVEYGLKINGIEKRRRRDVAHYFIDKVGLTRFRDAYPGELSGGMRQRVSVARAFANNSEILLMDEPFGALDEQTRIVLQQELLRLWSEHNRTVIFVTHSLDEAITLSDRIVVLSARPGRLRDVIRVDIPRPRSVSQLHTHPRYGELYGRLWALIEADIGQSATGARPQ